MSISGQFSWSRCCFPTRMTGNEVPSPARPRVLPDWGRGRVFVPGRWSQLGAGPRGQHIPLIQPPPVTPILHVRTLSTGGWNLSETRCGPGPHSYRQPRHCSLVPGEAERLFFQPPLEPTHTQRLPLWEASYPTPCTYGQAHCVSGGGTCTVTTALPVCDVCTLVP